VPELRQKWLKEKARQRESRLALREPAVHVGLQQDIKRTDIGDGTKTCAQCVHILERLDREHTMGGKYREGFSGQRIKEVLGNLYLVTYKNGCMVSRTRMCEDEK